MDLMDQDSKGIEGARQQRPHKIRQQKQTDPEGDIWELSCYAFFFLSNKEKGPLKNNKTRKDRTSSNKITRTRD